MTRDLPALRYLAPLLGFVVLLATLSEATLALVRAVPLTSTAVRVGLLLRPALQQLEVPPMRGPAMCAFGMELRPLLMSPTTRHHPSP